MFFVTVFMVIILASVIRAGYKRGLSKQQLELYLICRLVFLISNPIFLFFTLLSCSLLVKICVNQPLLVDLFWHEIFPVHSMMEGPQDTGGGQPDNTNTNSSTDLPTQSNTESNTETNNTNDEREKLNELRNLIEEKHDICTFAHTHYVEVRESLDAEKAKDNPDPDLLNNLRWREEIYFKHLEQTQASLCKDENEYEELLARHTEDNNYNDNDNDN